jgi:hypothetical protein
VEKPLNARKSEDLLWLWGHSHTMHLLQLPFKVGLGGSTIFGGNGLLWIFEVQQLSLNIVLQLCYFSNT